MGIPPYDPNLSDEKQQTAMMLFEYMCRYFSFFSDKIQTVDPSYVYEKLGYIQRTFYAHFDSWEDFNKHSREYVFDLMEKKQELFSGDMRIGD